MKEESTKSERRDFLKAAGAAVAAGFPGIIRRRPSPTPSRSGWWDAADAAPEPPLRRSHADDYAELTSVADIDQAQIDKCLRQLKRIQKIAARVKVDQPSSISAWMRIRR